MLSSLTTCPFYLCTCFRSAFVLLFNAHSWNNMFFNIWDGTGSWHPQRLSNGFPQFRLGLAFAIRHLRVWRIWSLKWAWLPCNLIVIVPEKSLAPLMLQTYQPWSFTKEKILTTEQSVEGMKVELINLQPKLIAKNLGGFWWLRTASDGMAVKPWLDAKSVLHTPILGRFRSQGSLLDTGCHNHLHVLSKKIGHASRVIKKFSVLKGITVQSVHWCPLPICNDSTLPKKWMVNHFSHAHAGAPWEAYFFQLTQPAQRCHRGLSTNLGIPAGTSSHANKGNVTVLGTKRWRRWWSWWVRNPRRLRRRHVLSSPCDRWVSLGWLTFQVWLPCRISRNMLLKKRGDHDLPPNDCLFDQPKIFKVPTAMLLACSQRPHFPAENQHVRRMSVPEVAMSSRFLLPHQVGYPS